MVPDHLRQHGPRQWFAFGRHHHKQAEEHTPLPPEQPHDEETTSESASPMTMQDFLGESRLTKEVATVTSSPELHSSGGSSAEQDNEVQPVSSEMDATLLPPNNNGADSAHDVNGISRSATPEPEELSSLDEMIQQIRKSVKDMRTLLKAIRAPFPTQTGDGSELPPTPDVSLGHDVKVVMQDLKTLGFDKIEDLAKVVESATLQQPLDDKKYLMEHLIQAAAVLPEDLVQRELTSGLVTTLWNDLDHPPQTLLSEDFVFRQPDGSKNSFIVPQLGAAGMPYARTTKPSAMRPGNMPDPGVLFDTLMARKEPVEHPNKISSFLFYLASVIIHDVFRTNRENYNVSDTSSYLDLAPLYGSNWKEQKMMRTMKDGKIKPDCFSEQRLLTFPPGVGVLLILFNRYHNHIVEQLALINEDERFTEDPRHPTVRRYPDPDHPGTLEEINKRDDDLFQTGRLITCGLYVNIILIDYVRTILNLNRTDDNWQLNPRVDIPNGPPIGTGNQVSCEFNLVYRWHAAISNRDDAWTQELWKELFPDVNPDMKDPKDFGNLLKALAKLEYEVETDPFDRRFPVPKAETLERVPDGPCKGNYRDNDLAAILTAGIQDCANAMGPQNVPTVLKAVEILGIIQARTWKVATLNEFRQRFALEPHRTFESITSNKEVSEALKHLYATPDHVELYPGLVIEDAKRPVLPGSGLCPGYTISRGVLSDANALVRGDRFFTSSYTPAALTNWGYEEASSNLSIDNGCVLYKLFLRALPNSYDPASVYVHYPMTIPKEMELVLNRLGKAHKYNFDTPKPILEPTVLFTYDAALEVMNGPSVFVSTEAQAMRSLMHPQLGATMYPGDESRRTNARQAIESAIYLGGDPQALVNGNEKWVVAVRDFFEQTTTKLLAEKSYKLAGIRQVDIVRDVGNLAPVHFAAEIFSLPLKTRDVPHAIYTEQQLYLVIAAIYTAIHFDIDPTKSFPLRQRALEATQQLSKFMEIQAITIKATGSLGEKLLRCVVPPSAPLRDYGVHMIAQLLDSDIKVRDLVCRGIMPILGEMIAPISQLFGQIIDFFFQAENKPHLLAIHTLAKSNTPETDEKLLRYLMEALRLNAETGLLREVTQPTTVADPTDIPSLPRSHTFAPGDKILLNLKSASHDPTAFPNPDTFDTTRPLTAYLHLTTHTFGSPIIRLALLTMLKVVARLENLSAAPVTVGRTPTISQVKKVPREFWPGSREVLPESWWWHGFLTEDWDVEVPFAASLKVIWTDPIGS